MTTAYLQNNNPVRMKKEDRKCCAWNFKYGYATNNLLLSFQTQIGKCLFIPVVPR